MTEENKENLSEQELQKDKNRLFEQELQRDKNKLIENAIKEFTKVISDFVKFKYSHDKTGIIAHVFLVGIILVGIISLALCCKIESSIIGTLLGSLIGFSFGNFPKNGKGNQPN
jgi:hypothetical protein